ncbi:hypothetical protein BJP34_10305 [Moorena producens PAL-8-15-08-1]|uniref:Glycosyltransferase n=2 Tax=Moorena TaxID=1155738 RepID=A0A1D8TQ95_9CYAN|nr:hypothetical protein BJP34_10305 [Moorena producens PAL-8-15-08-1]
MSAKLDIYKMGRCWLSDHHVFTTQCFKHQLKNLGVTFYDYALTGHWHFFYSQDPARRLRVLDRKNTNVPYNYEHYDKLASKFADQYGKWSQKNVDFYWCSFKSYMTHVFSKCERPIVLQLSFRFEGNQKSTPEHVKKLIELLLELRAKGQLFILASNRYDQMYFEYFTGVTIPKVPLCACHIKERYHPHRNEILIGPARHYPQGHHKISQIKKFFAKSQPEIELRTIRELYPQHHEYRDLSRHRAIIVLPYTIYTGAIVEYLAMGIPMFMPTSDLLSQWHIDDYLLVERKSDLSPTRCSMITGELHDFMPDPNNDYDLESVNYWLKFCEWYDWPIETFSSLEELEQKLRVADLESISKNMFNFERQQYDNTLLKWQHILQEIHDSPYGGISS